MPKYRKSSRRHRSVRKHTTRHRSRGGVLGSHSLRYNTERCVQVVGLDAPQPDVHNNNIANVSIAWQQVQGAIPYMVGFNGSARFVDLYNNYDQYAVKSLKIEFIPTSSVGTTTSQAGLLGQITKLWYAEDIDDYATMVSKTDEELLV